MTRSTRALVLLVCLGAAAATEVAAQPEVLVRAGVIRASNIGADAVGLDGRTGLSAGASLHFEFAPWVGFELGAGLAQKGFVASGVAIETVRLDYLQFPVMLRLDTPSAGLFSAHVFGGPAVSLKGACQLETETVQSKTTRACFGTGITAIKVVDFNALFGGGVELDFGWEVPITLDFVYDLGLRVMDADDPGSDLKNRSWALLLGTRISLQM